MKRLTLTLIIGFAAVCSAIAQLTGVHGTVIGSDDEPIVGASIRVRGSNLATTTDINGNFSLAGNLENTILEISYVGMVGREVKAEAGDMVIILSEDKQLLDDVVVIGYGSSKAKDLTAPIQVVKGEELLQTPSSNALSGLQGKLAGVNVINGGAPGASPTVRIRGIGSFSNSSPLFVVDGMFYDNIDFLNSNDIQEMSILKDASAAAIYGVRAANGVVIITTKKGSIGQERTRVTYNGYVGVQKASNVLELCNASEYATMMLEGNYDAYSTYFKAAIDRWGGSYADADFHNWKYNADSDWYDLMLRDAVITDHSLSIDGGSNSAIYSVGASYTYQDGVLDAENNFKRINIRGSVDFDATNWMKVGFKAILSNSEKKNPNNAAWQKAFNCPPIIAAYDDLNEDAYPIKYGSPASIGYGSNFSNPLAVANYYDSKSEIYNVLANTYADFTIIPEKLQFKTSFAYNFLLNSSKEFIPQYLVSGTQQQTTNSLTKSENRYNDYVWDNVISYNDRRDVHKWGLMAGYSMREESYRYLWGKTSNVPEGKDEYHYISQGDASGATVGDAGTTYRGQSYFARANYSFDNRYLIMATFRADGSSKYQEHWGYFPSVGAAWVLSNESFIEGRPWVDFLKVRASWGKLGNDKVAASDGFASLTSGVGASGVAGNTTIAGVQDSSYFSYLAWETVDEWNVGFNYITLNNRLNIDVDWYHRMTNKAVISPLLPFSTATLAGNHGKILNTGFDISANWTDAISRDFSYNIGVNITTLKNRVKDLNGQTMIRGGKTVNWVGHEMNSFYGFKCIGIYQTEAECAADPLAVQEDCVPGDLKFADLNGDGKLDANDRTTLGSYIPNLIYGINLGARYKNIDLSVTMYGQAGAQMFNRKRALRYSSWDYNFDKAQYDNRWTGPGTSNTDPSASALMRPHNVSDQRYSSYFVESADFFRIQNITLGYSFRNIKMGNYTLPGIRLSVTADRPFTTFKANSFSPEIADAAAQGWDTEVYPMTSTYTFGVKIDF